MDYLSLYKNLVRKAKREEEIRKLAKKNGDYYEKHHIIPKSKLEKQGKPNKIINGSWNLVLFTAKEHHMAHWFLYKACLKIYGEHHQLTIDMRYTINMMSNFTKVPNSKLYENSRKEHSKMISERMSGKDNPLLGTKRTKEWCENHRIMMTGRTPTQETRDKLHITSSGENNGMYGRIGENSPCSKKYRIYFKDGRIIEIYGSRQWCKENGYNCSKLCDVLKGRRSHHKDIIKVEYV